MQNLKKIHDIDFHLVQNLAELINIHPLAIEGRMAKVLPYRVCRSAGAGEEGRGDEEGRPFPPGLADEGGRPQVRLAAGCGTEGGRL